MTSMVLSSIKNDSLSMNNWILILFILLPLSIIIYLGINNNALTTRQKVIETIALYVTVFVPVALDFVTIIVTLIVCVNQIDTEIDDCIHSEIWEIFYCLFAHIPLSFYVINNLGALIGTEHKSGKRIISQIVIVGFILLI